MEPKLFIFHFQFLQLLHRAAMKDDPTLRQHLETTFHRHCSETTFHRRCLEMKDDLMTVRRRCLGTTDDSMTPQRRFARRLRLQNRERGKSEKMRNSRIQNLKTEKRMKKSWNRWKLKLKKKKKKRKKSWKLTG
jgi:hypothetical protein